MIPDCTIDSIVTLPILASGPTGPILSAYARVPTPFAPMGRYVLQRTTVFLDRPNESARQEDNQNPCKEKNCCNSEEPDKSQLFSMNGRYFLLRLFTHIAFTGRYSMKGKQDIMGPEICS
jgi:hypothetical protein